MASLAVAAVFATPSDFLTAPLHRRASHVVTNSSSVSGCLLTKRGDSRRIGQRHRAASLAIRCSSGKGLKYVSVPSLYFVSSIDLASALSPELKSTIDKVVQSQKVVLFMKGTKEFPQCGFSNTVVQVLNSLNVPFDTLNILENEILRQGMKEYSNWPTFPQLYIDGEFFGGCDIVVGILCGQDDEIAASFAINYGLGFAILTAILCHVLLFDGQSILKLWRQASSKANQKFLDLHRRMMKANFAAMPQWWLNLLLLLVTALSIYTVEGFGRALQLFQDGLLLAMPALSRCAWSGGGMRSWSSFVASSSTPNPPSPPCVFLS
ncbi:hypothetical protein ZIOFF_013884 [Zingiber officinale]|uniref:Glutaredoxin domain-containing protein n=1 Tax=Zingiber officinale TaxID=94328 RepID=A0A8J5LP48_ZINOF|nr:hypothetical protein ZIOFF_013884 [Zingiber officinale]